MFIDSSSYEEPCGRHRRAGASSSSIEDYPPLILNGRCLNCIFCCSEISSWCTDAASQVKESKNPCFCAYMEMGPPDASPDCIKIFQLRHNIMCRRRTTLGRFHCKQKAYLDGISSPSKFSFKNNRNLIKNSRQYDSESLSNNNIKEIHDFKMHAL